MAASPDSSPVATPASAGGLHVRGLLRAECVHCAERTSPLPLLRGEPCSHCGLPLEPSEVLPALLEDARARARRSYPYAALAGALAGSLPVLLPVLLGLAMVVARFRFVRPLLRLLTPLRRLHYRLSLGALFGLCWLGTLSLVPALSFLPLVNILLGALTVLAAMAAYLELGLWGLGRALDAEWVERRPLTALHWLLPGALLALLLAVAVVVALLVGLGVWLFGQL